MNRGYLVSFEGQDATGKSTLIRSVQYELQRRDYPVKTVDEFSDSLIGSYIKDMIAEKRFIDIQAGDKSAFTQAMYIASDLYYQDESRIKPSIDKGMIVLKDRHLDSLIACQMPKVKTEYGESFYQKAFDWIKNVTKMLYQPDLTIMLRLGCDTHIGRIIGRGEDPDYSDLDLFSERDSIYKALQNDDCSERFIDYNNERSIDEATKDIANAIERMVIRINNQENQ